MKSTGMIRRIDGLGRLVIPMELCRTMGLERAGKKGGNGTPVEIYVEGEQIILKKYNPDCYCCEKHSDDYKEVFGRNICPKCFEDFKKAIGSIVNSR